MRTDVTPDLEGYEEMVREIIETFTPEERLAGLPPEQRLAGLSRDEALLALPDDVLRTLPEPWVDGLPSVLRDAIRARVGRAS